MNRTIILSLACILSTTTAYAEETAEYTADTDPKPSATRQWLELQRSGQAASTQRQPLSGEVLEQVHKRYVESFSRPIPERFDHEDFTDN
jgi:hypothetical protein